MQYKLPKGYLSFSAIELWRRSKDQYRMKYYGSEEYNLDTIYTRLGKRVAETLEDKKQKKLHPHLSKVPAYSHPEFQLEVELNGVPIKGFIDSFDVKKKRIMEYKTGVRRADGTAPWDNVKFKKHDQTLLYTACVNELLGEFHPENKLVWLETAWQEKCDVTEFNGQEFRVCKPELDLTGHFEVFKRNIELWELEWIKNEVRRVASEIDVDYKRYLSSVDK